MNFLSFHPTDIEILNVFKKYFNENVYYIEHDYIEHDYKKTKPSQLNIYIYYKYPGFDERNYYLNAECLMIEIKDKTIFLKLLKYPIPNRCKISGVELLCLLYTVAKELEFNISIPEDSSLKSYTSKENPSVKDSFYLADYYILLKGDSWYGQYGYFSKKDNLTHYEKVRNLSISEYFKEGNNQGQEEEDVDKIINYINNNTYYINDLNGQQITPETPIKDVMQILDNIKRKEESERILYLDDTVIQIIILILKQDVIKYEEKGRYTNLLLDINNPEIDNIYKNLCNKLTITIKTGGKKYMRRKKTIRKKLKKQKKKYTYKNKKMKYKYF